jgi:hypothetical protein
MPAGDIATTFKRLKNTIADYDRRKYSRRSTKKKKYVRFFLETKLDTTDNILEFRTLKANQLSDEVFDKPAELEKPRATRYVRPSGVFHQAVHRQNKAETRVERCHHHHVNLNLTVMPLPYFHDDYNEWIPYKDTFSRPIKDN